MATPLKVRNRRREAQRTIRLAINACNSNLDAWKAAIDDGKKHATNLTNAILTLGHIPQLPLAALNDIPSLKTAALTKLTSEIDRHYTLLANSLILLEEAAAGLTAALAPLTALAQQEESDALLHGNPVFTTLTLHIIVGMFEKIEQRYLAELQRKQAVVQDFKLSAAKAEKQATSNSSNYGSTSRKESKSIACSEGFLQVHITAWMLSPEVEEAAVQSDILLITQDASSC